MRLIENWIGHEFKSSSVKTKEFKAFAMDFKQFVKSSIPPDAELVEYNVGHFYVSGFIRRGGRYVYFCTHDVRSFGWWNEILVRQARDENDYTGGINHFATCDDFYIVVNNLLA